MSSPAQASPLAAVLPTRGPRPELTAAAAGDERLVTGMLRRACERRPLLRAAARCRPRLVMTTVVSTGPAAHPLADARWPPISRPAPLLDRVGRVQPSAGA
jgi:hypothetical protein